MEEHEPTGDLKLLLERFRTSRGVVDYVLMDSNLEVESDALHRIAVWFGMMVVKGRLAEMWTQARFAGPVGDNYQPSIDRSIPRLASPETVSVFLQDYHSAFGKPPYPLEDSNRRHQLNTAEIDTLFGQINTLIFGEFAMWSIRRWNTDWSSYFDDGREWWGTYLWTLVHENLKHCVWIGASSTD